MLPYLMCVVPHILPKASQWRLGNSRFRQAMCWVAGCVLCLVFVAMVSLGCDLRSSIASVFAITMSFHIYVLMAREVAVYVMLTIAIVLPSAHGMRAVRCVPMHCMVLYQTCALSHMRPKA